MYKELFTSRLHTIFGFAAERELRPLEQVLFLRKRWRRTPGYRPTLHHAAKTKVTCSALICALKHHSIPAIIHNRYDASHRTETRKNK